MEFFAPSVSYALAGGLDHLLRDGVQEPSRNGPVLVAPRQVTTIYEYPTERVLFGPIRDANPFFHLMESLWMLAGRNDIAFPARFNARMSEYSDDGKVQWGAYGHRWRHWFGHDQVQRAIKELKDNAVSRRAVVGMWDPEKDPAMIEAGRDVPCNTHIYFDARGGRVNMTVCCRSNDVIWGAYGANAVHFSILLEYVAAHVGSPVGEYRQMSNNFHAYLNPFPREKLKAIRDEALHTDFYMTASPAKGVSPRSMVVSPTLWDRELGMFLCEAPGPYNEPFFAGTAWPMLWAWEAWKRKDFATAVQHANDIESPDWRVAALGWVARRQAKWERKSRTDLKT
jgi:hypothetical protein